MSTGTDHQSEQAFGQKTIGFLAGFALMVNNITGPGIPSVSNVFSESGWLLPSLCFVVVWLMTSISSNMYAEAMRKVPGNEHFSGRIEYTTIVKHYFGRTWYIFSQIGLNGALQALNIISVIQSAQVMDSAVAALFGKSCALNMTPFQNVLHGSVVPESTDIFSCTDVNDVTNGSAWGCHVVLSVGFVVVLALTVPWGMFNLEDNIIYQNVAFVLLILVSLMWVGVCVIAIVANPRTAYWTNLPAVNTDPATGSQAAVLGIVLFNFGFVTTVPSWINEKTKGVSVNKTLWYSTTFSLVVFIILGILGALAFPGELAGPATNTCQRKVLNMGGCASSLSTALEEGAFNNFLVQHPAFEGATRFSVYLFTLTAVMSGIPIFSIVIKYNMVENGFSDRFGFWWGVIFPWVVGFPLSYMPNVLSTLLNISSLVFVAFTDFVVPWALYVALLRKRDMGEEGAEQNSVLTSVMISTGVSLHHAVPYHPWLTTQRKICLTVFLAVILVGASLVATGLTITQSDFTINEEVCALVSA